MRIAAAIALLLLPARALAYGEPSETGVPNHEERLVHVLTNQVRQAPHDWPGWDTTLATADARPPLALDGDLERAARFHADDMATHNFFSHDSSDGTTFQQRVSQYFQGPAGENIYMATFGGGRDALTAWMNSTGHRTNILDGSWNRLGPGFASAMSNLYYVQDFGARAGASVPPIPGGAIEPQPMGQMNVIANWFDPRGRAPMSFVAHLGPMTITLVHTAGAPGNETWSATAAMPSDCEHLTFVALDADQAMTTFPSTGALLVGSACQDTFAPASSGSGSDGGTQVIIGADVPHHGCSCSGSTPPRAPFAWLLAVVFLWVAQRRR
jgi:MYXO-CTERM domain-containing protein